MENRIVQPEHAENKLAVAKSPISIPLNVWIGLYAVHTALPTVLVSWVATLHSCIDLGYPQTARWIEENLGGLYGAGVYRGFVALETGAVFVPTCYPIGTHAPIKSTLRSFETRRRRCNCILYAHLKWREPTSFLRHIPDFPPQVTQGKSN